LIAVLLIGVFKAHKLFVIERHEDADNEWRITKDPEEDKLRHISV
jgi:hypothetical protein